MRPPQPEPSGGGRPSPGGPRGRRGAGAEGPTSPPRSAPRPPSRRASPGPGPARGRAPSMSRLLSRAKGDGRRQELASQELRPAERSRLEQPPGLPFARDAGGGDAPEDEDSGGQHAARRRTPRQVDGPHRSGRASAPPAEGSAPRRPRWGGMLGTAGRMIRGEVGEVARVAGDHTPVLEGDGQGGGARPSQPARRRLARCPGRLRRALRCSACAPSRWRRASAGAHAAGEDAE